MPMSPAEAEAEAVALRRLYADAETEIMRLMALSLSGGIDLDMQWAEAKLVDLRRVQREIGAEVARLGAAGSVQVERLVEQAYLQGVEGAVADMVEVGASKQSLVRTNVATARAFAREAVQNLESTHLAILRKVDDVYRAAVAEGVRGAVAGVETRRQAAQRTLNVFADRGVTGFVDSAGRNWGLPEYAEMATRTGLGRAAVQGHVDTLIANAKDLVIISDSPEECPLCAPWESKILSLSGRTPGYPTMDDARSAGLFHANCSHRTGLYTPGLTKPMQDTANPNGYAERQEQRQIERNIRKWRRREAVAMDDQTKQKASGKVKDWRAEMSRFINDTERRRQYQREQIVSAH